MINFVTMLVTINHIYLCNLLFEQNTQWLEGQLRQQLSIETNVPSANIMLMPYDAFRHTFIMILFGIDENALFKFPRNVLTKITNTHFVRSFGLIGREAINNAENIWFRNVKVQWVANPYQIGRPDADKQMHGVDNPNQYKSEVVTTTFPTIESLRKHLLIFMVAATDYMSVTATLTETQFYAIACDYTWMMLLIFTYENATIQTTIDSLLAQSKLVPFSYFNNMIRSIQQTRGRGIEIKCRQPNLPKCIRENAKDFKLITLPIYYSTSDGTTIFKFICYTNNNVTFEKAIQNLYTCWSNSGYGPSFTFDVILTAEDEKFVMRQITGNHNVPKFRRMCKLHLTLPKGHEALVPTGCTTSGHIAQNHGCTMSDHYSTWRRQRINIAGKIQGYFNRPEIYSGPLQPSSFHDAKQTTPPLLQPIPPPIQQPPRPMMQPTVPPQSRVPAGRGRVPTRRGRGGVGRGRAQHSQLGQPCAPSSSNLFNTGQPSQEGAAIRRYSIFYRPA